MRIAIYETNPMVEAVASRDDDYGQMFEDMLAPQLPDASFEHFDVVEGMFPDDPTEFDGVVITGSSAFVTDTSAWIETLFSHILEIERAKTKLFAVCFGHQAVAMALGGAGRASGHCVGCARNQCDGAKGLDAAGGGIVAAVWREFSASC